MPRGRVQVLEALGDRPLVGPGVPRELLVGERSGNRVAVGGYLLELPSELLDLWGEGSSASASWRSLLS
jgi:hypothetical protein